MNMSGTVICIGAAFVDELFYLHSEWLPATTNPATVSKTAGGVSRNIAHQLSLLGVHVHLISVFGDDSEGQWLKQTTMAAGVHLEASVTKAGYTGKYTGILNPDGSLHTAFLTNAAIHLITPEHLEKHRSLLECAAFILADANIAVETMDWLLAFSRKTGVRVILETVSVPPAAKYKHANLEGLYMATPNEDELPALCNLDGLDTEQQLRHLHKRGVKNIWLHRGKQGSAIFKDGNVLYLSAPKVQVVDCTGAGDGSVSGFLLAKTMEIEDVDALKIAHVLSAEILQVKGAIAHHLSREKILDLVKKYYP